MTLTTLRRRCCSFGVRQLSFQYRHHAIALCEKTLKFVCRSSLFGKFSAVGGGFPSGFGEPRLQLLLLLLRRCRRQCCGVLGLPRRARAILGKLSLECLLRLAVIAQALLE